LEANARTKQRRLTGSTAERNYPKRRKGNKNNNYSNDGIQSGVNVACTADSAAEAATGRRRRQEEKDDGDTDDVPRRRHIGVGGVVDGLLQLRLGPSSVDGNGCFGVSTTRTVRASAAWTTVPVLRLLASSSSGRRRRRLFRVLVLLCADDGYQY